MVLITLNITDMKKYAFTLLFILSLNTVVSAQEFATDKKAIIIAGSASFTSAGGDFFEDSDGNKANSFTFSPNVDYFISKNFFIGGTLDFATQTQGDFTTDGFGVGPEVGYTFGSAESKAIPYLEAGVLYYQLNSDFDSGDDIRSVGSNITLGFGVIVPVEEHIGVTFGAGYNMLSLKDQDSGDRYTGRLFSVSVGIAGLLF